jgi:hypothetical protein
LVTQSNTRQEKHVTKSNTHYKIIYRGKTNQHLQIVAETDTETICLHLISWFLHSTLKLWSLWIQVPKQKLVFLYFWQLCRPLGRQLLNLKLKRYDKNICCMTKSCHLSTLGLGISLLSRFWAQNSKILSWQNVSLAVRTGTTSLFLPDLSTQFWKSDWKNTNFFSWH